MNVTQHPSGDVNTHGGGEMPPCTGFTPDALPEIREPFSAENSQTGVSTRNVLSEESSMKKKAKDVARWYALRVTYGRERKAYEYLIGKNIEAYYPTIVTMKIVDGKRKAVERSRLPNIFFARGTEDVMKSFVYDNVNLPYLRFYYRHFHEGRRVAKEPLVIPDHQIDSLKIICASEASDYILMSAEIPKFKTGQTVRIVEGEFKGVVGKVARYKGQQRVGVIIDGLLTIATAYVPRAFIREIN
ncbi:MAG: UpxY family transcription antiterminator [Prevotella sp.]